MAQKIPLIRIYGIVHYDRGAKARWLLTELKIPYESHWVGRATMEEETSSFRKLSPMGRVPVAEIGEVSLFESSAILSYLADLFADHGMEMAPALGSPERAKYEQWMSFAAATLDQFQTRVMIIEDIPPGQVQEEKQAALLSDLGDAMDALDQSLGKGSFLVANRFTAADINVSYHLYWLTLWPELKAVMEKRPRVMAYLERMCQMPSATEVRVFSYEEIQD